LFVEEEESLQQKEQRKRRNTWRNIGGNELCSPASFYNQQ
jgi:hypothetical protein